MPNFDEIVDAWFNGSFANGPVSRDTEAYNQIFKAKDELKKTLAGAAAPVVQKIDKQ